MLDGLPNLQDLGKLLVGENEPLAPATSPFHSMIVCVCQRVSDRDIRQAALNGVRDFEVLQIETDVSTACGCCEAAARAARPGLRCDDMRPRQRCGIG